jgi:hypothetical protein
MTCVCADLKNLNVEQFGNGESRCWCTRWIPCSGHILFGSQIAWSLARTSPKKIEKENPSKIDIKMMVLSVWGLWWTMGTTMNPSMNQTDSNGNPAEKTSKMRMKGRFHMSIAFAHSRTRICQGLKDFPKDAEGPSIQLPTFQTLSKQAKALMMPPTNSSNVTFHGGKNGKRTWPKGPGQPPAASGTLPLRHHCPSSGTRPRSPEPSARSEEGGK